jgi:uncharacterized protein YjbI with pentapeptide repeats
MKPWRVLQCAIGLAWILLLFAGCGEPPEPPIAEVCMCEAIVYIEAYVDRNANGKQEPWEDPLQGARFRVEWQDPYKSPTSPKEVLYVETDATGQAEYTVLCGCYPRGDDYGTAHAEVLPGYELTTPDRCYKGCAFGFAALDATPSSAREADLRAADLQWADLQSLDLSDADLTGANLREANLRGAQLRNAELSGADLQGADLRGTDLTGANLREAYLRIANLRYAQMSGAVLTEANLIGADLSNADLSGAVMSHAQLLWADLHGADLQGANLSDASLESANLSAANLSGADLVNANLHEAKYDRHTQWPEGFDPVAAGAVLEE